MKVKIEVKQEIVNGVVGPKKYSLHMSIPYTYHEKEASIHDLDAGTIKELVTRLTEELEDALKV